MMSYAKQLEDKVARLELEVRCLTRRLEQRPVEFTESLHTAQIMAAKEAMVQAQLQRDRVTKQNGELREKNALLRQLCEEAAA